jgi:hypothetical protein
MNDIKRGMIKWQPFNSVINSKETLRTVLYEKEKVEAPILSDEDEEKIEQDITLSYYTNNLIEITYFKDGYFYKIKVQIKKIDKIYKRIYLSNNICLLFKQITNTKLL